MASLKAFSFNKNKKEIASLSKVLERIIPKDTDKDKPFHYWIDSSRHKLFKEFCQNPQFSQFIHFHCNDKKQNKNRKIKKSSVSFVRRKSWKSIVTTTSNFDSSGNEANPLLFIHRSNLKKVNEENDKITEKNENKTIKIILPEGKIAPITGNVNNQSLPLNTSKYSPNKWFNDLDNKNPIKLLFEKKIKNKSFTSSNISSNTKESHLSSSISQININQNNNQSNSISTQETKRNARFFELLKKEIRSKSQLRPLSKNASFRLSKFSWLVHKCEDNIKQGNNLDSKMEKNNEKLEKILKIIEKGRNQLNKNEELALFQQLQRKKTIYDIIHEKSFQKIKESVKFKVSENFAYYNRKNYKEIIQHRNRDEPYELYAQELNKIIEKILKKKANEKKEVEYIDNILDKTLKDKEFLKNKINCQQMKYSEIKEKELSGGYCSLSNRCCNEDKQLNKNEYSIEKISKFGFKNKSFDSITMKILENLEKKHKFKN